MVNDAITFIPADVEDAPWRAGISFLCKLNFCYINEMPVSSQKKADKFTGMTNLTK